VADSVLVSLAILKANSDLRRRDYVENFLPFCVECLRNDPAEVVSLPAVRDQILKDFGLDLPASVISTILKRLQLRGILSGESGALVKARSKIHNESFAQCRWEVLRSHSELVESFQRYCQEKHDRSVDSDKAESIMENFINENQVRLLTKPGQTLRSERTLRHDERYMLGSYLRNIERKKAHDWECFERVFQGHMLANAVYLPVISEATRRIRGRLYAYCDTRLLIFALGYAASAYVAPSADLLALLKTMKIDVVCFAHTRDEIFRALDACAHRLGAGRLIDSYGPSMEHFIENRISESDVRMRMNRLEDDLRGIGVRIVEKPAYKKHEYVIDERGLASALSGAIPNYRETALEHDVDCVAGIMRLRGSHRTRHLEDCRAIFVTTNRILAQISSEFLARDRDAGDIAPCITDFALTNILWLKQPTAAPDLPRKRIMADCYAAIQPSAELWAKCVDEVEKLSQDGQIDSEDYYELRYSLATRDYLMEETCGVRQAFVAGTVSQIRARMAKARQRELAEERAELEREHSRERAGLEDRLATLEQRDGARRRAISGRAEGLARVLTRFLGAGMLLVLLLGTIFTFPVKLPPLAKESLGRYLLPVVLFLLFVFLICNAVFGVCVKDILARFEKWTASRLARAVLSLAGDDQADEVEKPDDDQS